MNKYSYPTSLFLRLSKSIIKIDYIKSYCTKATFKDYQLIIEYKNKNDIVLILKEWLLKFSKDLIKKRALNLSKQTQLFFKKISVKKQKTIWGSCSSEKNINLNYKLIFLPEYLADHVILHELCHLKFLNHSKSFWCLLKSFDPSCDINNHFLKRAETEFIPILLR